jgi:hypothetical protein
MRNESDAWIWMVEIRDEREREGQRWGHKYYNAHVDNCGMGRVVDARMIELLDSNSISKTLTIWKDWLVVFDQTIKEGSNYGISILMWESDMLCFWFYIFLLQDVDIFIRQ